MRPEIDPMALLRSFHAIEIARAIGSDTPQTARSGPAPGHTTGNATAPAISPAPAASGAAAPVSLQAPSAAPPAGAPLPVGGLPPGVGPGAPGPGAVPLPTPSAPAPLGQAGLLLTGLARPLAWQVRLAAEGALTVTPLGPGPDTAPPAALGDGARARAGVLPMAPGPATPPPGMAPVAPGQTPGTASRANVAQPGATGTTRTEPHSPTPAATGGGAGPAGTTPPGPARPAAPGTAAAAAQVAPAMPGAAPTAGTPGPLPAGPGTTAGPQAAPPGVNPSAALSVAAQGPALSGPASAGSAAWAATRPDAIPARAGGAEFAARPGPAPLTDATRAATPIAVPLLPAEGPAPGRPVAPPLEAALALMAATGAAGAGVEARATAAGVIYNAAMLPGWPYPGAFARDGGPIPTAALRKLAEPLARMTPEEMAEYLAQMGVQARWRQRLRAALARLEDLDPGEVRGFLAVMLSALGSVLAGLTASATERSQTALIGAGLPEPGDLPPPDGNGGAPRRRLRL